MPRILCFGDSNTYGYDPRDPIGDRFPPAERWPEILAERTGWEVVNLGSNGRRIPGCEIEYADAASAIQARLPADCLIIMLGSNDVFCMREPTAERIAARMEAFLSALRERVGNLPPILLVSPPQVRIPLAHIQHLFSKQIPAALKPLADAFGLYFESAADWKPPLSSDMVHFSAEGHRLFAEKVEASLRGHRVFARETETAEP